MLITGTAYKMDFAAVAVRMMATVNFLAAESILKEMEQENETCSYNNHTGNDIDHSGYAHPVN